MGPFCIKPTIFYLSVLAYQGDIQIGMMEKKGQLEVEVIRARGLVQKPGSKSLPGEAASRYQRATGSCSRRRTPDAHTSHYHCTSSVIQRIHWAGAHSAPSPPRRINPAARVGVDHIVFSTNGFFIVLSLPSAPYVKVYLLNNGAYVAKKKTKIARKTLDPLYQQALLFEESPQGKVLQVSRRFISHHHKDSHERAVRLHQINHFPSGNRLGRLWPHGP